ncbi:MAG: TetR/AcrR family transcriptional regulator [Segniliparus sp.]|uniref:TetR/AcrR family transcriptional regulator n=1 Tax=Segniliparus sp. TaxID=2804064 RepID=UPI003F2F3A3A
MTTPRYHHGDLREAVLARAEAALRETGAEGLSLRKLARDLGVSHAAPSRHFKDKQALLDALAVRGFSRLGEEFASASAGSVVERVQELARRYLAFAIENPALLAVMFSRKHCQSANTSVADAANHAFRAPLDVIAKAQERGEARQGDPTRIGLSAMAAMQGLAAFVNSGFIGDETATAVAGETIARLAESLRPLREGASAQTAERVRSEDTAAPSR